MIVGEMKLNVFKGTIFNNENWSVCYVEKVLISEAWDFKYSKLCYIQTMWN